MGEGFQSLPTVSERIVAMGSFMRRQAYIAGENLGDVMRRRMGDCRVWEHDPAPMMEYVYGTASAQPAGIADSSAEMVDLSHLSCHLHILTLSAVELEPQNTRETGLEGG